MFDIRVTDRGFEIVEFTECHDQPCSLQQSSAVGNYPDSMEKPGSSYVWLGVDKPTVQIGPPWQDVPLPEDVSISGRMHLNREQVTDLVFALQNWLRTGSFEKCTEEFSNGFGTES